jgi:hypothetical protein
MKQHGFYLILLLILHSSTAAASGINITVSTDKHHYLPHEPILVTVTAANPTHHSIRLDFTSSHQAGYIMDHHYDWAHRKGFLTVLTHVTIPPHAHHQWKFHHDWREYAPAPGHHSIVGYVVGYGHSHPVPFDILMHGDVNADGAVDITDLGILAANWGQQSVTPWHDGDLNGDGAVNVADLGLLASNWGESIPLADAFAALVPEPALLGLIITGLLTLQRRRH